MSQQARGKIRIRKGDRVMVIAGRERGKTGKVLALDPSAGKVTIEKLNIIKRHTKPSQKARQGGILEREAPMPLSNVMLYCGNCQKPVPIGIKQLEDGRRMRICRKCQEVLENG